ncbi:hypothetical protein ECDEC13E_2595 [Escherichia coli DEC13E]|nr:hypothetical protein ECDEC13E_2595 [Escherichia coli DEC13E]
MLGGADNPNGELLSYIIGADTVPVIHAELYSRAAPRIHIEM